MRAGLQPRPHRLLPRCQPALGAAPACVLSRSMVLKHDWYVPWRPLHCPLPWRHAHTTHHERMTTRFDPGRAHCSAAPARCRSSHAWSAPGHGHRAAPGTPALPASGRRSASRTALRRWPATAAGAAAGRRRGRRCGRRRRRRRGRRQGRLRGRPYRRIVRGQCGVCQLRRWHDEPSLPRHRLRWRRRRRSVARRVCSTAGRAP